MNQPFAHVSPFCALAAVVEDPSASRVVVEVDAATLPPAPAIVTPFETSAVLSLVGQEVVSQLRPTRQQPPR
jgi:hypothetical protein